MQLGARPHALNPVETFALACIAGDRDTARVRLAADPTLLEQLGHTGRIELLHRAIEANKLDGVRLIVSLGVGIDAMVPGTGFDRTVLHDASAWGTLDMVQLLISLGADPALRDLTHGGAAIGWAAYGQRQEIVDYLLQFASIVDAVRCGGIGRVTQLLDENPSLANARDPDGRPLTFCLDPASSRADDMIALLTSRGVDLNAPDDKGRTVLELAVANRLTTFASLLRKHGAR